MSEFKVGDIVVYHTVPLFPDEYFKDVVWIVTHTDIPGSTPGTVRIEPLFGDARWSTYRHSSSKFIRRITDDDPNR